MVTRQERPPSHREKFSSFHVSFYVWRAFVNDVVVFVVVVELDSLYTYIPSPLCVLLAEGQSVCLWVWLSWCEASFAAAIEWRDLTPKVITDGRLDTINLKVGIVHINTEGTNQTALWCGDNCGFVSKFLLNFRQLRWCDPQIWFP